MDIAHVTRIVWEHGTHGGMEAYSQLLVEGLRARGHRVTTITTACPGCAPDGDTVYLAGTRPGRYSAAWRRESARKLLALQQSGAVDVVLSQSAGARAYALASRGGARRLPSVYVLHGTLAGEWRTRWRNARSPRGFAQLARFLVQAAGGWWRWRKATPFVDCFVAVSEQVATDARRTMGIPPGRLKTVLSGVDTTLWQPDPRQRGWLREELGLPSETPVLLAAGRLERGKGYHVAIDAIAATPARVHLVILGAGSAARWLRERAAAAGVADRVHLAGWVEQATLARYFQAGDLFLMPTLAQEALPTVLLQALATGLPVVASDVGGVPSAVQAGENGLLIRPGDSGALAEALRSLLADPSRREAMRATARERAVARFSHERMVGEIEAILRQVAGHDDGR